MSTDKIAEDLLGAELKKYGKECDDMDMIEGIAVIDAIKKALAMRDVGRHLSVQEVLNYEIHSHWLASWIRFEWGQDLMGKYFAWKVRRKYNSYLVSLEERKRVFNGL